MTGIEGLGKSVFVAWIIARLTRGKLPGEYEGEPITVLVVANEDGLEDTWRPRLELAKADLERVEFLRLDRLEDDWNIRDGIDVLARATKDTGARVIFIDALMEHLPSASGGEGVNAPTFVRRALRPLKKLCRTRGVVALYSVHPPKARATEYRGLVQAGQAFSAVPRVGLLFAYHPDDDGVPEDARRRVVLRGKGNLGRNPGALSFRVVGRPFEHDDGRTTEREVVTEVVACDVTLPDLLADKHAESTQVPKVAQAEDFIRDVLADGRWHASKPLIDALAKLGISATTVTQARKRLGVVADKDKSRNGPWRWRLVSPGSDSSTLAHAGPPSASTLPPHSRSKASRSQKSRRVRGVEPSGRVEGEGSKSRRPPAQARTREAHILSALAAAGSKGLTRTQIAGALNGKVDNDAIDRALSSLRRSGAVTVKRSNGRQRWVAA